VTISIVQCIILIACLWDGGFASPSLNPMLGPPALTLVKFGGNIPAIVRADFSHESWRLVVPIFLHAGFIHILANVFTQIQIGRLLEGFWGMWRLITIYFISSIGGNLTSATFQGRLVVGVGASGGVMGLMGAILAELLKNWTHLW